MSGLHTTGVAEVETEAEEEAVREREEGGEGIVRGVIGRGIKRWGVQNGGMYMVRHAPPFPRSELINEAVKQSISGHVTKRIERLPNGER